MADTVRACFIVDDFPACPIYQTRMQGRAFGYDIPDVAYSRGWEQMSKMELFPLADLRTFADLVDRYNLRGKFTCLGFPAGRGRLDRRVRGYSDAELAELLTILRDRLAPRFDITPETLTHTMAGDPETGALLPHCETHWLSRLAADRRIDDLADYIGKAYEILANVGIQARGLTIGGMPDLSGISASEPLTRGFHRKALAEALARVERRFNPKVETSFIYTGSEALSEAGRTRFAPELVHACDEVSVYEIFSITDPVWDLMRGEGDAEAVVDRQISPDLSGGEFIDSAECGRAIVVTVHSFTLNSNQTHLGFNCIAEMLRRLHQRYGRDLRWHTPIELIDAMGVPC